MLQRDLIDYLFKLEVPFVPLNEVTPLYSVLHFDLLLAMMYAVLAICGCTICQVESIHKSKSLTTPRKSET